MAVEAAEDKGAAVKFMVPAAVNAVATAGVVVVAVAVVVDVLNAMIMTMMLNMGMVALKAVTQNFPEAVAESVTEVVEKVAVNAAVEALAGHVGKPMVQITVRTAEVVMENVLTMILFSTAEVAAA